MPIHCSIKITFFLSMLKLHAYNLFPLVTFFPKISAAFPQRCNNLLSFSRLDSAICIVNLQINPILAS